MRANETMPIKKKIIITYK